MAENNKSYRIRTKVGREADTFLDVHLDQDYDSLEILSLKISDKDTYRLHNSDYGVIVGRVLANGNFGVPNAKISVFIPADEENSDLERWNIYPYTSTSTKNDKNIRYNLLPDESVKDCHKAVGTFPNKTYLLENEALLEVFDDYYIYTTRTNAAGDYLICGVPTGMQTLHMDLDLSDCGILSQRPRDFVYKGYTIEQFENPNQFKKDENIDGLSQIFSQNQPVYVKPFWGNKDNGEEIGITRADIEIAFKFEPTCVFLGSAISDNSSNGVGKKCVPTNQMGVMDELTAGEGTIEMIRKTPGGNVEEFSIKGNQLIDGNGVWCYQIPMNLDYMMTDEFGNMVPTDDPEKGIPTRTRVRFRASLTDMENSSQSYYRAKYLIPNNPRPDDGKVDYNFGTYTEEDSYRDLFWNGVYTVKSYIPRFQKSKRWKSERFSGIKACNYYGGNNPMPYNNLRIRLPFMFTVLCIFVKLFIKIVSFVNRIIAGIIRILYGIIDFFVTPLKWVGNVLAKFKAPKLKKWADNRASDVINKYIDKYSIGCTFIGDGLCPDMEGWYFAPGCGLGLTSLIKKNLLGNTLYAATGSGTPPEEFDKETQEVMNSTEFIDETSTDTQNTTTYEDESACVTTDVDYLVNCFEMNLAQEYRVIKFDFYNDWVNGVLYFPRWMRKVKRKKKYKISFKKGDNLVTTYYRDKVQGCMNAENSTVKKTRYYTQQCSMAYTQDAPNSPYNIIASPPACYTNSKSKKRAKKSTIIPTKCHKKQGMTQFGIFGKKSGLVTEQTTMLGQFVYYLKPCEWKDSNKGKSRVLLFATDIVLLGTLNDCDENGIPQSFKYLNNSSYVMPTNMALTTMDDDTYIYTSKDGTVCSSKKSSKETIEEENVNRVTPNYESTTSAYSKTDGDQVVYQENDDPIPVTEAAGIVWNYSGPGQDDVNLGKLESPSNLLGRLFGKGTKNRLKYLYYPGGHFLGLSCVNSETNIKSCVNLKRICEMGATMSQRREELRSYTSDGNPLYRYYVPTGLISNVDIEAASFRAMFATINHSRLIATKTNEETGYKTYDFRFLRPDGFDGALSNYVHQMNSPYNKRVNEGEGSEYAITDATTFFERLFGKVWQRPEDYDENEVDYTERRTVEDSINDYYMFRFGLDTFSDKEQKKHFLDRNVYGLLLPQYENSFYFYFGLKDGSTALDEFKKQFFSECEANNVMKEPILIVKEAMNENLSDPKATLIINNMVGPYTVVISDNTLGIKTDPTTFEVETIDIEKELDKVVGTGYTLAIGREYTITVTDSIDQVTQKTFVFGASVVKMETEVVNFRQPGTGFTRDPKKGGFIKIGEEIRILKKSYLVPSDLTIVFKKVENGRETGDFITSPTDSYTDVNNENWQCFYLPSTGTYNLYLSGSAVYSPISVFTFTIDDNTEVNLYVACDYLAYKGGYNLSALTEEQWLNSEEIFGQDTPNAWLMRHTFYRQTQDDTIGYDHYIYPSGKDNVAIFGQAENAESLTVPASLTEKTFSKDAYDHYVGYSLDDKYSFITTKYWNNETGEGVKLEDTEEVKERVFRRPLDAMAYSDDGRAAADATNALLTSYIYNDGEITLTYSANGANNIVSGHGCVVVLEDGTILFPVVEDSTTMKAYSQYNPYENAQPSDETLKRATIYPTMRVPSFYKPFYGVITATTWNNIHLNVSAGEEEGSFIVTKEELPTSYKVEGIIFNGLSYNGKFYPGPIDEETGQRIKYDTFFLFNDSPAFFAGLTTITAIDYWSVRPIPFGSADRAGFYREIKPDASQDEIDSAEEFDEIVYGVRENTPPETAFTSDVFTERYEDGFDRVLLTDSCSISECFYDNVKIQVTDASRGVGGECLFYTEENKIEGCHVYLTNSNIFSYTNQPLMVTSSDGTFAYGYYNQNAKYDKKGELVTIKYADGKYIIPFKQENGSPVDKRLSTSGQAFDSGVTILETSSLIESHKYDLNSFISQILGTSLEINLRHKNRREEGNPVTSPCSNYNTLIQKYVKPTDGTKNSITLYRIAPVRLLDVVFPTSSNGIEPYISPSLSNPYPATGGTVTIPVATNVDSFSVTTTASWIHIESISINSVTLRLDANTSTSQRTGTLEFKSSVAYGVMSIADLIQAGDSA